MNEFFTASCEHNVLRLRWAPEVHISYEIAVRAARVLSGLSGGRALPLLVDLSGVTGLTPEARAGMNAYRGFSAVALIGDGAVGKVMAAFARRSVTPTAYFTTEADALTWLRECEHTGSAPVREQQPEH
ncbi:MAG: STAS/SEC14 domain-containing protein [Actinomycetes bacterium]